MITTASAGWLISFFKWLMKFDSKSIKECTGKINNILLYLVLIYLWRAGGCSVWGAKNQLLRSCTADIFDLSLTDQINSPEAIPYKAHLFLDIEYTCIFLFFMRCCLNVQIESICNKIMRSVIPINKQALHKTEIKCIKLVIVTKIFCFPVFKMCIRNSNQPFLKYNRERGSWWDWQAVVYSAERYGNWSMKNWIELWRHSAFRRGACFFAWKCEFWAKNSWIALTLIRIIWYTKIAEWYLIDFNFHVILWKSISWFEYSIWFGISLIITNDFVQGSA